MMQLYLYELSYATHSNGMYSFFKTAVSLVLLATCSLIISIENILYTIYYRVFLKLNQDLEEGNIIHSELHFKSRELLH